MVRIAVLVSGNGTNLQSLFDRFTGDPGIGISLVLTDRSDAGALKRARQSRVDAHVLVDHEDADELLELLTSHQINAVVLAGYLKLVPAPVVKVFAGRMINIHPALLPAFGGPGMYGHHVHRAVLAAGAKISGPTVHLVSDEYDRGDIVAQWPVAVLAGDTVETLAARVLAAEHQLLPRVVSTVTAQGKFQRLDPNDEHFKPCAVPMDADQ